MSQLTEVAAAVLLQPDGHFLLAQRPAGKPYPGYWEFPGGKLEAGESAYQCLVRELKEELNITVHTATPWIVRTHHYTHATVRLQFFRVTGWSGELAGLEGQAFEWQSPAVLAGLRAGLAGATSLTPPTVGPMLPANTPIFRALAHPDTLLLTHASTIGEAAWLTHARRLCEQKPRLIQLREKGWPTQRLAAFAAAINQLALATGSHWVVNSSHAHLLPWGTTDGANNGVNNEAIAGTLNGAHGIHLTSADLAAAQVRPANAHWCGASCHTAADIAKANALALDYVVLGPVAPTNSHPGQAGIGWAMFSALASESALPVYAIGGQSKATLSRAQQAGAQGVALLSGVVLG